MAASMGFGRVVDMARHSGMLATTPPDLYGPSADECPPPAVQTNPFLPSTLYEVPEDDPEEAAFREAFNKDVEKGGVPWPGERAGQRKSGPLQVHFEKVGPSGSSQAAPRLSSSQSSSSRLQEHGSKASDADNAFHIEACEGNVEALRARLASGDNVNRFHPKVGGAPLHYAAEYGRLEAVQLLLEAGADIEAKEVVGRTALHLAARNGHLGVVKALLDRGANINTTNLFLQTPLHVAAERGKTDVCSMLASRGANLQAKDKLGRTPLHDACREGKQAVVEALIKKGADINARDQEQGTPLQWAAAKGHSRVVLLLMKHGAEKDVCDASGSTPQHDAATNGHATMVEVLLKNHLRVDSRDQEGRTPLHKAAENGRTVAAQVLLKYGASVSPRDHSGKTPLDLALEFGRTSSVELLQQAVAEDRTNKERAHSFGDGVRTRGF